MVYDHTGEIVSERARWMPIEGTYSDVVAYTANPLARSLRLDGNPSKFIQGHNCWGLEWTDEGRRWGRDLDHGLQWPWGKLYQAVREAGAALPGPQTAEALGFGSILSPDLTRADLTRSIRFRDDGEARSFLRALGVSGHTRHKNAKVTQGTVYFGRGSRRWTMKAYLKSDELKAHPTRLGPEKGTILGLWAVGVVRFELTLRGQELKAALVGHRGDLEAIWRAYYGRVEMAARGNVVDVEAVEGLPGTARLAYQAWAAGQDVREVMAKTTFYRVRRQILDVAGVDIAEEPAPCGSDLFGKPDPEDPRWDPEPAKIDAI